MKLLSANWKTQKATNAAAAAATAGTGDGCDGVDDLKAITSKLADLSMQQTTSSPPLPSSHSLESSQLISRAQSAASAILAEIVDN